jgi:predicted CXXCH cytochrome family protein
MKRLFLGLSLFIMAGILCYGQDLIIIDKIARLYPPFKFTHEKHMEISEGDCKKCHHFSGEKTPPCSACHTKDGKGNIKVPLREAYHGLCIRCHKDMAGPTSCKDCHGSPVKKYDLISLSQLSKLYNPVTFTHGKHINLIQNCRECHHKEEGITYSCSPCHSKEDVYKYEGSKVSVGLKGAYHGLCLSCHKKTGKGPLKCTSCHEKRAKK